MDSGDGSHEDAALLLAIKDAEVNTLRQQMAQLADDLKRNLAVLATKDDEAMKLRSTVDGLRALLAEKDNLFAQFHDQVQELEVLRIKEAEQRAALEQVLAVKQEGWKQQQEAAQKSKEAELAALQQQLKEAEDKWSAQLMQTRQTALDESIHRSTQQQSAIERAMENGERLQQQVDCLTSALGVKEAELEAAHRQLGAALESTQKLEATHAKAIAAKESLVSQLKQQLDQQAGSLDRTTGEHDTNMTKLITSLNQMQESCQTQAMEVQEYAAGQKRLQEERRVLREQMRQQEAAMTKLQTEKGVYEAALQHEVTAQATAQAQLNIFQAKLTEAVVELERRCAAAECRSSKLMGQLVEERGRLVDAVIEQANSSTPQLAAELAKSLEADRLRTQAELQMSQERAKSLAEDLSLIRSTLLPLLAAPAATAAAAMGGAPPAQAGNGSLAALAQMMAQKEQQQQQQQQQQQEGGLAAAAAVAAAARAHLTGMGNADQAFGGEEETEVRYTLYSASPAAASAASPGGGSFSSPVRGGGARAVAGNAYSPGAAAAYSPAPVQQSAVDVGTTSRQYDGTQQRSGGGGSLAGLVFELQGDVEKLQQQLHNSRRQLKWDGQQDNNSGGRGADAMMPASRPSASGHHHHRHHSSTTSSPVAARQQQEHISSPALHSPSHHTPLRHSTCATDSPGSPAKSPEQQLHLHEALRYLLDRTEQLSAENGALKTQLVHSSSPHSSSPTHKAAAGALQPTQDRSPHRNRHNCSSSPHNKQYSSSPYHRLMVNDSHHNSNAVAGGAAAGDGACDGFVDDASSTGTRSIGGAGDDDLSSAADEELAAAQAVAAAECSRRRRRARAAAAQRSSRHAQEHNSPRQSMLQRSNSVESGDTTHSSAVSDLSSCGTLSAAGAMAAVGLAARTGGSSSSSKQLLETVLASWPTGANNKLGKLLKELIAATGSSGSTASAGVGELSGRGAAAAGRVRGAKNNCGGGTGGVGGGVSSSKALAREQLRRLAELSPARQRLLLRALAGAER